MLIDKDHSALLVVDVQARLLPAIAGGEAVIERIVMLLGAARQLAVPTTFLEQSPQALGPTDPRLLEAAPGAPVLAKMAFSGVAEPAIRTHVEALARRQTIVAGTEAHVCLLQTALGLRQMGQEVLVVADAVGSRRTLDRDTALERLRQAGCIIITAEMVVFEWLRTAAAKDFRALLELVK